MQRQSDPYSLRRDAERLVSVAQLSYPSLRDSYQFLDLYLYPPSVINIAYQYRLFSYCLLSVASPLLGLFGHSSPFPIPHLQSPSDPHAQPQGVACETITYFVFIVHSSRQDVPTVPLPPC